MNGDFAKLKITKLPKEVKIKIDPKKLVILQIENAEPKKSKKTVDVYLCGYVVGQGWVTQLQTTLNPGQICSFDSYHMQVATNGPKDGTYALVRTPQSASVKVTNKRNIPANYMQVTPINANNVKWWAGNITVIKKDSVAPKEQKEYTLVEGEQAAIWYGVTALGNE